MAISGLIPLGPFTWWISLSPHGGLPLSPGWRVSPLRLTGLIPLTRYWCMRRALVGPDLLAASVSWIGSALDPPPLALAHLRPVFTLPRRRPRGNRCRLMTPEPDGGCVDFGDSLKGTTHLRGAPTCGMVARAEEGIKRKVRIDPKKVRAKTLMVSGRCQELAQGRPTHGEGSRGGAQG